MSRCTYVHAPLPGAEPGGSRVSPLCRIVSLQRDANLASFLKPCHYDLDITQPQTHGIRTKRERWYRWRRCRGSDGSHGGREVDYATRTARRWALGKATRLRLRGACCLGRALPRAARRRRRVGDSRVGRVRFRIGCMARRGSLCRYLYLVSHERLHVKDLRTNWSTAEQSAT